MPRFRALIFLLTIQGMEKQEVLKSVAAIELQQALVTERQGVHARVVTPRGVAKNAQKSSMLAANTAAQTDGCAAA